LEEKILIADSKQGKRLGIITSGNTVKRIRNIDSNRVISVLDEKMKEKVLHHGSKVKTEGGKHTPERDPGAKEKGSGNKDFGGN